MAKASESGKKMMFVVAVVLVISLVLYLAGVFSGLYASKVIEKKTTEKLVILSNKTTTDLESLREGTEENLDVLKNYITFLETNVRSMQFEQTFSQTLTMKERCAFSNITMRYLMEQLRYYREILPFRLEEYERENDLSDEYRTLKKEYTELSLRTWINAKNNYEQCNRALVHGLYFYSRDCDVCVRQGEELDLFTENLTSRGFDVMLFTIDTDSDDPIVSFNKEYYGITSVPVVIVN
ncbi:hypothetical protein COY95_04330, partial [Candidatus Woesearchaeota archaeon CG_4_10_14_0_8_um_filter_47_5]